MSIIKVRNRSSVSITTLPTSQTGAVLIVVLIFLLLITLVGVIAVRNSTTDLKLATADQINTVLLQSADSANNKIELAVNSHPSSEQHKKIAQRYTGIFGYYVLGKSTVKDDIIDFCYRPRSEFFNLNKAVIRRDAGRLVDNATGYCDPTKSSDYTSNRETNMTQIMIKNVSDEACTGAFCTKVSGEDSENSSSDALTFDIYSTAVLPAYSTATTDKVKKCFEKDASSDTDSVGDCMADNSIPSKTLVERAEMVNATTADYCKYFGATAGSDSALCTAN